MKNLCKYLILFYFTTVTNILYADSISQQRDDYKQIKIALKNYNKNLPVINKLLHKLKDYSLYPYLQYDILMEKIKNEKNLTLMQKPVINFIKEHSDLKVSHLLSYYFTELLVTKHRWKDLMYFSPKAPKTAKCVCDWYYAKWSIEKKPIHFEDLIKNLLNSNLVSKKNLLNNKKNSNNCDKLFLIPHKYIATPPSVIIEYIRLAMKKNNHTLINYLIKLLPSDYKNTANTVLKIKNNPLFITDFVKTAKSTPFNLQLINYSIVNLSPKHADLAIEKIPIILSHYKMENSDIQSLKEIVANNMMDREFTSKQKIWRDSVIINSKSVSLIEKRIRLSLKQNNIKDLKIFIEHLPYNMQAKEEWQYWKSYVLLVLNNNKIESDKILYNLMKKNSFYSLIAAQKLGISYQFKQSKTIEPDPSISKIKKIIRINELMYWNKYCFAKFEWNKLLTNKSNRFQTMLASYANKQQWWHLSVETTIQAKIWNNLKERFPLAWNELYKKYTKGKNITKNYAMAISRQESGWDPYVKSANNAVGLMQIKNIAFTDTMQICHIKQSLTMQKLFNPENNIWVGTNYLEHIFKLVGKNRVLASAAYNAGLSKINQWRRVTAGKLDVVAFIESIPFKETRQYVKNVLLYNAYYNYLTGKPENILTPLEWNHSY
ncbi:murein transglycosylase [Candidatus Pantoea edessiphila]|uniref:murein transglycosylase n=1 Tax=Candidatus Pantoea edessiphila TaxID=2044610 RepID=UPI001319BF37|nr:murein transglycosylase [Candidatus Pantoea edessiphila]